jgi:hypothetical protein
VRRGEGIDDERTTRDDDDDESGGERDGDAGARESTWTTRCGVTCAWGRTYVAFRV